MRSQIPSLKIPVETMKVVIVEASVQRKSQSTRSEQTRLVFQMAMRTARVARVMVRRRESSARATQ